MEFPKSFTDARGREWTPRIGLVALERMKDAGIPLEEIVPMPGDKNPDSAMMSLTAMLHDSCTAVRAIMAILAPALAAAKVDRMDFLESIDTPEVLCTLGLALQGAIIDFFHRSPIRQAMIRQAIKRGPKMMEAAARSMEAAMDRVNVDEAIKTMEEKIATLDLTKLDPTQLAGSISAMNTQAS